MWGKERKQKKALIEENESWLHEELITTFNGRHKVPLHFFTAKELMGARNKFIHPINRNPYIKFSQGSLDHRLILVKTLLPNKFQHLNCRQAQIHDIVITSQMSHHKNVWKLLGFCLEFVAVMVYEYDAHFDILGDLLYGSCATDDTSRRILAWTSRLRIANDIANAVVYLHMAFPTPIIHRKIIPYNIIVDQRGVAKLFDFSQSILLPPGKLELEVDSMVGVLHAMMPPEYVRLAIVSQKTDVYTFGVLLLALLTGRNAFVEAQLLENSPNSLSDCLAGKELHEFADPDIMGPQGVVVEQEKQQLQAFLQLALKCVQHESEDRPEMIEVGRELRLMMKYSESINPNALEGSTGRDRSFSLCIELPLGESQMENIVRGKMGYTAPDYIMTGIVSESLRLWNLSASTLKWR